MKNNREKKQKKNLKKLFLLVVTKMETDIYNQNVKRMVKCNVFTVNAIVVV